MKWAANPNEQIRRPKSKGPITKVNKRGSNGVKVNRPESTKHMDRATHVQDARTLSESWVGSCGHIKDKHKNLIFYFLTDLKLGNLNTSCFLIKTSELRALDL